MSTLSLDRIKEQLGEMFIVRYPPSEQESLGNIRHILVDGQNFPSKQTSDLYTHDTSLDAFTQLYEKTNVKGKSLFCIDHEGGRVHRFGEQVVALPSAVAIKQFCKLSDNPEYAYKAGQLAGKQLRAIGIPMSLGPVLDIGGPSMAFPSRCFGESPEEVILYAGRYMDGLKENAIVTAKHFPGHGSVYEDSHLKLPCTEKAYEELKQTDLKPFESLISKAAAIMTAHIIVKQWDPGHPATFSKPILSELEKMGFTGVIVSDSLTMQGAQEIYKQKFDGPGGAQKEDQGMIRECIDAILAGCNLLIIGRQSLEQSHRLLDDIAMQALSDEQLSACIATSAEKVERMLQNYSVLSADSECDLPALNKKARTFSKAVALSVVRSNGIELSILEYKRVVVFAPSLLEDNMRYALEKISKSYELDVFTWKDIAPGDKEMDELAQRVQLGDLILIVTYNAEREEKQRELVKKLHMQFKENLCVCESNYSPEDTFLSWTPEKVPAVCTYSADSTSLKVGFEKLLNI